MTVIALKIDVDTFRGTRIGVPRLLDLLARHDIKATFFFSVGPDNMGRHVRRLLNPEFALKMWRSRAPSIYGWDILLAGTFWPGRKIGANLGQVIRAAESAGHEIGLHAWDHHRWQIRAGKMSVAELQAELESGYRQLGDILGRPPDCSAAAGWICNLRVLEAKQAFGFAFNSDCRGRSVFRPTIGGRKFAPQVPTTLPTYDELIGRDGVDQHNYNNRLLDQLGADALNVLTIHAEVEGVGCNRLFSAFLDEARARGIELGSLGKLPALSGIIADDDIAQASAAGRAGDICWQRSALRANRQTTSPGIPER